MSAGLITALGADHPVALRGGVSVPLAVYWCLLDLEACGVSVRLVAGDVAVSEPARLTARHLSVLDRYRADVRALVAYLATPDLDGHLRRAS